MELSFTSILPYFIIMPLLAIFAFFFVKKLPFYEKLLSQEGSGRYEALDGLRGFLALNVFFQHAVTSYFYFQNGIWEIVPVRFYRHLGGEAVILFFMITSFLYWSKAIAQKGELEAGALYRTRFLRLAPMYFFSACIIIFSILLHSVIAGVDIDLRETARNILSWMSLGLETTLSVNHISVLPVNAGIHWTLHFEWLFYLLLPILATALKRKESFIMVLPIAFFALSSAYRGYFAIFFFGIIAAHIYNKFPEIKFFKKPISGLVPLLGIVLVYFISYKPYSFTQYAVSLIVFLSFVYGTDLFGLLKSKAAKFLGTMSYSIYLLHGIMLFAVLNTIDLFYPVTSLTPVIFWLVMLFTGIITIVVSSFTYQYIEHPFILRIKAKKPETPKIGIVEKVM